VHSTYSISHWWAIQFIASAAQIHLQHQLLRARGGAHPGVYAWFLRGFFFRLYLTTAVEHI
jgi:hypothetical protein